MHSSGQRLFQLLISFVKIVDAERESLVIELTGTQSKLEAFLQLLDGYEILELARTGIAGLSIRIKDVTFIE